MKDAHSRGRASPPGRKLAWDDVRVIRDRKGSVTGVAVAEEYGVSRECIYDIWRGRNWHDGADHGR